MHRIDGYGATPDNKFTEGSPGPVVIPPTYVTPDWANAVQEEIAAVIEGAGIALAKPQNNQLLQAILSVGVPSVPTIAALRLRSISDGTKTVRLLGYAAAGDGAAGPVRQLVTGAAAGTYVDNGGSIIVPTGGDGSAAWLMPAGTEVNVLEFGGDPTGATDSYPQFVAAKAVAGVRTIKFPGGAGTIYNLATYPDAADVLEGPLLDVAPGVIIRIPQADGLDATYGNGSIRVVRATRFHQSVKDVTFFVSPQTSNHVQERLQWLSAADADRTQITAVDCTVGVVAKKVNWDGEGDDFVADAFAAAAADSFSPPVPHDGFVHLGMRRVRTGEAMAASFSNYETANTALFAMVRCEGGYYGAYGGAANGALTRFYKLAGVARPAPVVISPESFQHDSYFALAAVVSIKVRDLRHFSVCLNGVAALDFETASDIIEAGFGGYDLGAIGTSLTVKDLISISGLPAVHGVRGLNFAVFGDSLSAGDGVQHIYGSWPEQFKRVLDGAAGVRVKNVSNYAVSGATSTSQEALCTAENLVGIDYALILLGTNDVQTGAAVAAYLANIAAMIDTAIAAGCRVVVGVPPMFYSQAAATGRGNNTTNFAAGAPYRSGLMRLCAAKQVKCVDLLGGLGNVLATYLEDSFSADPMVYDNIHPSMFGRLIIAQLFTHAVLGDLAADTGTAEYGVLLPAGGLAGGSLFATEAGRYSFDSSSGEVRLFGVIDVLAALANGTEIYTLPEQLWPQYPQRFLTMNGDFGTTVLTISTAGKIEVYNAPVLATFVSLQIAYNIF